MALGHINGTGGPLQARDDTASKGNKDNGEDKDGKRPKKKPATVSASKTVKKIKGLNK